MNSRVTSSEGNTEVEAPSSAPMLVMVARSGTDRDLTPSPVYSMILPTPPFDGQAAQHLQNHVLGRDPGLQLTGQTDADDLGHGDIIGAAAHGHRHVQAARAEGQHADAAAGGDGCPEPMSVLPGMPNRSKCT